VVELYDPLAEEKGVALHLDSAPRTMIRGNRHLLSQAVANLIDNALKYGAPEHGGGEVAISVREAGGRATIEVADHGPGVPECERDNVFDRFVRLEPSRSTPGNGLGLSLVRAVARRHSGTVTLGDTAPPAQPPGQPPGQPGLKVRIEFPAWSQAV
jgi:signal transduction histidine kinase